MPLQILTRVTNLLTPFSKGVYKISQQVRCWSKDLMKEGPEEAKRSSLKFVATAVEEERKSEVVMSDLKIVGVYFSNVDFPEPGFLLVQRKAPTANGPALIHLVSKHPLAHPRDNTINAIRAILHFGKANGLRQSYNCFGRVSSGSWAPEEISLGVFSRETMLTPYR